MMLLSRTVSFIVIYGLLSVGCWAETIPNAAVKQFFLAPDQPSILQLPAPAGSGEKTAFVILNYQSERVTTGEALKKAGQWEIPLQLPSGYYEVALPELRLTYGVDVIAAYEGAADPFFCMDSALSWLTPVSTREGLIQMLKRCGIAMSRERLTWPAVHSAADASWNWETPRAYDRTRLMYQENGIPLLELAHESPKWMIRDGSGKEPDAIVESIKDWRQIGKKWAKQWGAIEAWNEPDLVNAPADQYVAWVQTLRYALRSEGIQTPVGGGVLAYISRPFLNLAARCGLLTASDFISFHYYGDPANMEGHVAEFRRWLKEYGHEAMPLWLTECGAPWLGVPGSRASARDIQSAAMKFAGNAIESRACGVERFFAFVYVDYSEHGSKNFGMLDRNGAPTRTMAAYAAATRILAHKSYVGDFPVSQLKTGQARVFASSKGEAVIVVYTGTINPLATLLMEVVPQQILGADGRVLKSKTTGTIPVPDGLSYLVCSLESIRGKLITDTGARRLTPRVAAPVSALAPEPLILKAQMKNSEVTPETRGYRVAEGVMKIRIPILVANLADKEREVKLEFYDDAAVSKTPLTVAMGKVPPQGETVLTATVDFSAFQASPGDSKTVRIEAKAEGVKPISPLVLNFLFSQGLENHLKSHAYRYTIPLGEEHRWSVNITPTGKMKFEHGPEAQWGFTATFDGGDRWVYPRFIIPQEANLDRVQGILVRARLTRPGTARLLTWNEEGKQSTTLFSLFPSDGVWHVAYVPIDSFVIPAVGGAKSALGRQIKTISIGCNSQENENHLEVSDFYLLGN
ncbi:MAG: hypothetical protein B9S32_10905 [Verrucomicrobia bacterium Tous-C9LFEB]|nr:MAG: hypothetical protein B9S32_10905 [Verrucomicrobia bacterium Tous-C9LFEB]